MARWQNYLDQSSIQGVYQKAANKDAELARPNVVDPLVTEKVIVLRIVPRWGPVELREPPVPNSAVI